MNEKMLTIATQEARNQLTDQINAVDAVDQKIGIFFGVIGVILGILFNKNLFNKNPEWWLPISLHVLSIISLVISICFLFTSHRSVKLNVGLKLKGYEELIKRLSPKNDLMSFLRYQLKYFRNAIKENQKIIQNKNRFLYRGAIAMMIGFILYSLSYLAAFFK